MTYNQCLHHRLYSSLKIITIISRKLVRNLWHVQLSVKLTYFDTLYLSSTQATLACSVLTSLVVSVDVKLYWAMLRHWSQLVPNMSTDIWGHYASLHHQDKPDRKRGRAVYWHELDHGGSGGRKRGWNVHKWHTSSASSIVIWLSKFTFIHNA